MVMGQPPSNSASNTSLSSLNGASMPIPRAPSTLSLKKSGSVSSIPNAAGVESSSGFNVSNDKLLSKLKQILEIKSTLPEREFKHYEKRLLDRFTNGLDNESHKKVVLNALENFENKDQVKNDLIKFMLANDGVSTWCLPLRKVLENIQVQ